MTVLGIRWLPNNNNCQLDLFIYRKINWTANINEKMTWKSIYVHYMSTITKKIIIQNQGVGVFYRKFYQVFFKWEKSLFFAIFPRVFGNTYANTICTVRDFYCQQSVALFIRRTWIKLWTVINEDFTPWLCWYNMFQPLELISNFTSTAAVQYYWTTTESVVNVHYTLSIWSFKIEYDLLNMEKIPRQYVCCFQSNDGFKTHRKWLWSCRKGYTMWIWDWNRQEKYFEQN